MKDITWSKMIITLQRQMIDRRHRLSDPQSNKLKEMISDLLQLAEQRYSNDSFFSNKVVSVIILQILHQNTDQVHKLLEIGLTDEQTNALLSTAAESIQESIDRKNSYLRNGRILGVSIGFALGVFIGIAGLLPWAACFLFTIPPVLMISVGFALLFDNYIENQRSLPLLPELSATEIAPG